MALRKRLDLYANVRPVVSVSPGLLVLRCGRCGWGEEGEEGQRAEEQGASGACETEVGRGSAGEQLDGHGVGWVTGGC